MVGLKKFQTPFNHALALSVVKSIENRLEQYLSSAPFFFYNPAVSGNYNDPTRHGELQSRMNSPQQQSGQCSTKHCSMPFLDKMTSDRKPPRH
jgi:hypothetical protein